MEHSGMGKGRVEAFSDGVIAIIVTIMILELHTPTEPTLSALLKIAPSFLSYLLSFLLVAIMWVNHHHFMHATREVNARLLWLNMNLLFWMSLVPFVTDFMGKNHNQPFPVALYGLDLACCSVAFLLLRAELVRQCRHDPELAEYHSKMLRKNAWSVILYVLAATLAYVRVEVAYLIFVFIPATYFLPERKLAES
ncbi:MAG TPA: TMEM175 family protein [Terriglobales bacterium]|jgi:uncharacterized membrane protein|nr:TMEM175 family protein [Terriglobales bacterium]